MLLLCRFTKTSCGEGHHPKGTPILIMVPTKWRIWNTFWMWIISLWTLQSLKLLFSCLAFFHLKPILAISWGFVSSSSNGCWCHGDNISLSSLKIELTLMGSGDGAWFGSSLVSTWKDLFYVTYEDSLNAWGWGRGQWDQERYVEPFWRSPLVHLWEQSCKLISFALYFGEEK